MPEFAFSNVLLAFLITFAAGVATIIGGFWVVLSKRPDPRLLSFGLAFAAGAMVYVSLTEILNKSIESFAETLGSQWSNAAATAAFLLGMVMVVAMDRLIPNPHSGLAIDDPDYAKKSKDFVARVGLMTCAAISAHNFPEGLATFFATLDNPQVGLPLAVAIAVHNIPEGISIAAPIYFATSSKKWTLGLCALSGLAEPLGALLGYTLLRPFLSPTLFGLVFGLIAGIMVFLALDELLPVAKQYAKGHETVYGLVSGMAVIATSLVLFQV